ncbi:MAG: hypothetical protein ABSF92_09825 [Candidatus Acidiferrales bacterium]|jgi:hypothetical protein
MNIMNFVNTTTLIIICSVIVIALAVIATLSSLRRRRSAKLRTRFGSAEYDRALQEGGSRRHAEAGLDKRTDRVESLHIRPLGPGDRARFVESWSRVQARFVDGPGGAVAEADQLLRDVMSTRGYPISDFEQRAADISVDYPLVLENYRSAHAIAVRQTRGQASTEELRQAMIHYRTLFDELVGVPETARAKAAS